MAAAASLLPPARPAATGMRFSSRTASGKRLGAAPDDAPGLRDAREHEPNAGRDRASVGRPRRRRRAGCPRGPAAAREAQPVGEAERDHHRVEVVEAVAAGCPSTASVRFSFAGASRTTGVRRGRSRAAHSKRLEEPQPVLDGQGLRTPVAGDPDGVERCVDPRLPDLRPASRRPRRCAAGARARSGASCGARGSRTGPGPTAPPRAPAAARARRRGSSTTTADETFGAGSKASGGTRSATRTVGVVLDEDREVAHPARRRGDPLGDLGLDHQDEPLRARRPLQQPVQDRAGDVVRQVRHDAVRAAARGRAARGPARRPRSACSRPASIGSAKRSRR